MLLLPLPALLEDLRRQRCRPTDACAGQGMKAAAKSISKGALCQALADQTELKKSQCSKALGRRQGRQKAGKEV